MRILAQIAGLGAMLSLFLIYQQKSRRGLLFAKLSADVCWVVHYACLGAVSGMIPNFVGIFRELVFVNRQRKKWANLVLWPIFFIALNLALGMRTFHTWYNLLPILGSALVSVALWLNRPTLTKLISLPVSCAFLIYDIFVHSYIGIVNECIGILSILIFFGRAFLKKEKTQ